VATKSRVKTEEEYEKILGIVKEEEAVDKKITNDASQYFDALKGTKKDKRNPFEDKVKTLDELKESIKKNDPKYDVEKIKTEIAQNQVATSVSSEDDVILDPETIVSKPTPTIPVKQKARISNPTITEVHEDISNRLLGQLRAGQSVAVQVTSPTVESVEQPVVEDVEVDDIPIIEATPQFDKKVVFVDDEKPKENFDDVVVVEDSIPVPVGNPTDLSLGFNKPKEEEIIPPTQPSLDQAFSQASENFQSEDIDFNGLSDFTQENEAFLNGIIGEQPTEETIIPETHADVPVSNENPELIEEPSHFQDNTIVEDKDDSFIQLGDEKPVDMVDATKPKIDLDALFGDSSEDDDDGEYGFVNDTQVDEIPSNDLQSYLGNQLKELDQDIKTDDTTSIPAYSDNTEVISKPDTSNVVMAEDTLPKTSGVEDLIGNTTSNMFKPDADKTPLTKDETLNVSDLAEKLNGLELGNNNPKTTTLEEIAQENETSTEKKKFNIDILINIALVIMIVVIFFLLYQSFR